MGTKLEAWNCGNDYNGPKPKNMSKVNHINYSINMAGIESCSHNCKYCSAASTLDYTQGINKKDAINSLEKIDEKTYTEFKADFNKMIETIEHNDRFKHAKEMQEKQGIQANVHIDLWGGDPVTCHLATVETVDALEDLFINKHGMKLIINTSTGGYPLARNEVCDFIREHNMTCQLSHDGIGQWIRTGDIDPIYDEPFAPNIADMFRSGHLNMINDCLNFYNYDVFANKKYWDDYFKSIKMPKDVFAKMFIKLNRVYDGKYDLGAKNTRGQFGSNFYKELEGKPLGNVAHHNWKNANTGNLELDHLLAHELDNYMNDWLRLALIIKTPNIKNELMWKPYYGYIAEQVERWRWLKSKSDANGICRKFQLARHNLGDPEYYPKKDDLGNYQTFVIDTLGGYCECNLIDSEHDVKNPGGWIEPDTCKICKYYTQSECTGCGSEEVNPDCEYRYRWVQLLENVKVLDNLLDNYKKLGTKIAKPNQEELNKAYENGVKYERHRIQSELIMGLTGFAYEPAPILGLDGKPLSNINKGM